MIAASWDVAREPPAHPMCRCVAPPPPHLVALLAVAQALGDALFWWA